MDKDSEERQAGAETMKARPRRQRVRRPVPHCPLISSARARCNFRSVPAACFMLKCVKKFGRLAK